MGVVEHLVGKPEALKELARPLFGLERQLPAHEARRRRDIFDGAQRAYELGALEHEPQKALT